MNADCDAPRDIAGQFCGQWQPHAAHTWQTPQAYGMTTLSFQHQCAGVCVTPSEVGQP